MAEIHDRRKEAILSVLPLSVVFLVSVLCFAANAQTIKQTVGQSLETERDEIENRIQEIELERHLLESNVISSAGVQPSCVPSPLPSSPTPPIYPLNASWFNDEFIMEFWREPCVDGSGDTAVLFRATPVSGTPFLCGPGFSVLQEGVTYDTIKLQEDINAGSFCDYLLEPKMFVLNQWSIFDNFDDQAAFTLSYDGFYSLYSVDIPAQSGAAPSYPLTAYNIPNTLSHDRITLHFINRGEESAKIVGTLYHQDGHILGEAGATLIETLAPGSRIGITASDLESIFNSGTWSKRSRLESLSTTSKVDLLATNRTANGTTTNLTSTNHQYIHNIPSSINSDRAFIRISNKTDEEIEVKGTLYHQDGYELGDADTVLIPTLLPKATQVFTAAQFEELMNTDVWSGRARLEITSDTSKLAMMGLIRSSGTLTNMSSSGSSRAPNIPGTYNHDKAFIRITNTSLAPLDVLGTLNHQDGYSLADTQSPLVAGLSPKEISIFSAARLEQELGITAWDKRARLKITGDTSRLSIMNLIRSPSGILTNMSCSNSGSAYYIPSSSASDKAFIRITNNSDSAVELAGTLFDENGNTLGQPNFLIDSQVEANQTIVLNAEQLEDLSGSVTWEGLARLEIDSPIRGIEVLNLLRNQNGTLTNLSCSVKRFGLHSVSGVISIPANLSQDSDTNDPNSISNENNSIYSAQYLNNPFVVQGYANVAGAGAAGASFDSGDIDDYYRGFFTEGQSINLEIADADSTNDLDLYLYDEHANLLDASLGLDAIKSLEIPEDGTFYVRINAYGGASNYILSVSDEAVMSSSFRLRLSDEFVIGDIIAKERQQKKKALTGAFADSMSTKYGLQKKSRVVGKVGLFSIGQDDRSSESSLKALKVKRNRAVSPLSKQSSTKATLLSKKLDTLLAIKEMRKLPEVEWAEPNYIWRAQAQPSDEAYQYQWHYPLINLPSAWDVTTGSSQVIVAVLDSGVILDHPDLSANLIPGYDFVSDISRALDGDSIDADPSDPGAEDKPDRTSLFHGTHVAGTVGAQTNNDMGVAGVSWQASVMPIRVLGKGGDGDNWDIMQGGLYAAGLPNAYGLFPPQKADIINLSLGGDAYSRHGQEACQQVRDAGVIIVAAAGNDNDNQPNYPASYDGVVSVSAVDMESTLAPRSCWGEYIDVTAPGGNMEIDMNGDGYPDGVLSTGGDDSSDESDEIDPVYSFMSGTSMASPHVAGVFALMKSVYPQLTPDDVDNLLISGAITQDIGAAGRDDFYAYGMIDAYKAVVAATHLAGGGVVVLPPRAASSSRSVNFGALINSFDIQIRNAGDGQLTVNSVTENSGGWLTINAVQVDSDGLGTYRLSTDRSGLPPRIYSCEITFLTSANALTVQVSMMVPEEIVTPDAGLHYVLLIDSTSFETIREEIVEAENGQYSYRFEDVPGGDYYIVAGTDADNDYFIGDPGESCGGYPVRAQLTRVTVDRDINRLNFSTGVDLLLGINASNVSQIPAGSENRAYSRVMP